MTTPNKSFVVYSPSETMKFVLHTVSSNESFKFIFGGLYIVGPVEENMQGTRYSHILAERSVCKVNSNINILAM